MRLHSVQSLEKTTLGKQVGAGQQAEVLAREGGEEKEVVEYLVIEKKYDGKGVEGTWCVWGTTEETTGLFFLPAFLIGGKKSADGGFF